MFLLLYKLSRKSHIINKIMRLLYGCEIPYYAKIGKNVTFNHRALGVVIHPNTIIGDNVYIEHHLCLGQRTGSDSSAPVISRNVVIGAYAIILGGVTVGEGTVIGAGSLVLSDVPPNTIYYNQRIGKLKINNKPVGNY